MRRMSLALAAGTSIAFTVAAWAADPQVSNVRATQLADKTVEVLYDLAGAPSGGATVSVKFSDNSGTSYTITPATSALSGHVGTGVTNGTNRRIVWNAPATLPAEFYKTTMRAAVTAVDPGGGGGSEITVYLPGNVPLVLVKVPAGTFMMGAPQSERGRFSDETQHQVTLTQDYYMGKYEVTQRQWLAVMGSNPSYFSSCGLDCPVELVSWDDVCGGTTGANCRAASFIGKLNVYLGTTRFRLPTEAQWERAARGGTTGPFSFDTSPNPNWDLECGSFPQAVPYMWWCNNAGRITHPVGQKLPNPWGLYDMHGNVWEWVGDWYGDYPSAAVADPQGPVSGSYRVFRGGSLVHNARICRSAVHAYDLTARRSDVGFRLARSQ